jgi:hypothetical protein
MTDSLLAQLGAEYFMWSIAVVLGAITFLVVAIASSPILGQNAFYAGAVGWIAVTVYIIAEKTGVD